MPVKYDLIVIGGGHNGLVTAAYLAKLSLSPSGGHRQTAARAGKARRKTGRSEPAEGREGVGIRFVSRHTTR